QSSSYIWDFLVKSPRFALDRDGGHICFLNQICSEMGVGKGVLQFVNKNIDVTTILRDQLETHLNRCDDIQIVLLISTWELEYPCHNLSAICFHLGDSFTHCNEFSVDRVRIYRGSMMLSDIVYDAKRHLQHLRSINEHLLFCVICETAKTIDLVIEPAQVIIEFVAKERQLLAMNTYFMYAVAFSSCSFLRSFIFPSVDATSRQS
ncbi:hypothetical protein PFISCL1PPCAC_5498, partial [Pristionchus fissidentatus]